MRHEKKRMVFQVRVGYFAKKTTPLRVSLRWQDCYAAKYGDVWFWVQHDVDGNPFIDPEKPIPGGFE